mmetsp:Transcript_139310/g.444631  ORF Transcript_139310/g.444631 Transcript_139310/m.444631 type:complete len:243 (+) Transcript_139310:1189-1917(+)
MGLRPGCHSAMEDEADAVGGREKLGRGSLAKRRRRCCGRHAISTADLAGRRAVPGGRPDDSLDGPSADVPRRSALGRFGRFSGQGTGLRQHRARLLGLDVERRHWRGACGGGRSLFSLGRCSRIGCRCGPGRVRRVRQAPGALSLPMAGGPAAGPPHAPRGPRCWQERRACSGCGGCEGIGLWELGDVARPLIPRSHRSHHAHTWCMCIWASHGKRPSRLASRWSWLLGFFVRLSSSNCPSK